MALNTNPALAGMPDYSQGMLSRPAVAAAAPNYNIGGEMPFGGGGNPYQGGGIADLGSAYQKSYNSALAQNSALYSNILGGYQQVMGNQVGAQQAIQGGYGDLYNNVLGGIQGISASQSQAIKDTYAQQQGQTTQGLISRGLGNTTVADSLKRGLTLDEQKAQVALSNQTAALNAGYQSQLGLAGLNFGNQANMQNTGEGNQQLGWMNTVQAQYPNAASYNQLAQMSGQFQQANADRDLLKKQAAAGGARVGAGAGVSGVGFKSGGGMGQAPSLYQHGLTPDTSAYSGGGAGAAVYPSSGAGIQQPWPTLDQPGQYDTYDVNTQQGYNTNDPGYQDPGYDTYDLYSQQGYNSYDQGYSGGGDWFS